MKTEIQNQSSESWVSSPLGGADAVEDGAVVETELARYLPHIDLMSRQLTQTSMQIESSVVDVCKSFHGIAERARSAVARTTDFLSSENDGASNGRSFEGLIENCSGTLVKILNTTEEANQVSTRAIERIQQMDKASKMISAALGKLEQIARENKMLAMNARIEAAHAGNLGAGFAVVAVEVVSQTERAQAVTAQVNDLITDLRALADSTVKDLERMNDRDHKRMEECRREVDESLRDMQLVHGEMKTMLTGITEEGQLLANDIGSAVRGLQFQDRTSQQISHVVDDLNTLQSRLTNRFGAAVPVASNEGFSAYTTYEERKIAGMDGPEAAGGDVELF